MEISIYALVDPRCNTVKYVGKTIKDPLTRLSEHISNCHKTCSEKNIWLSELKILDLKPIVKLLEIAQISDWSIREAFWIDYYSDTVLNIRSGGQAGNVRDTFSANAIRYDNKIFTIHNVQQFERDAGLAHRSISQVLHGRGTRSLKGWKFEQRVDSTVYPLLTPEIFSDGIAGRKYLVHTPTGEILETNNLTQLSKSLGLTLHKCSLGTIRNGYWVERVDHLAK